MSVFTKVLPHELAAWLKNYELGELLDLQGIVSGIENTNYFVTTTQGRFVLTLFEKLTAQELPFYLELMAHLAKQGFPSPMPIPNKHKQLLGELNGKPASLVTRLSGQAIEAPSIEQCMQVGAMLARMHILGETYGNVMSNPRGPAWWRQAANQLVNFLTQEQLDLLTRELEFQSEFDFETLQRGVIHADLFRDNVLFDHGQITGVIDFYFACVDVLLFDIAVTVNDWCLNGAVELDEARAVALLNAYCEIRPLSEDEREAWPMMLRAAALRFWLSRLYDFHLPRPGELTHAKDPTHFQRLLERHVSSNEELKEMVGSI